MTDEQYEQWVATLTIVNGEAFLPDEQIIRPVRRKAASEVQRRERIRIQHRDYERQRRARLRHAEN